MMQVALHFRAQCRRGEGLGKKAVDPRRLHLRLIGGNIGRHRYDGNVGRPSAQGLIRTAVS